MLEDYAVLRQIRFRIYGAIKTQKVEIAHCLERLGLTADILHLQSVRLVFGLDVLHPRKKGIDNGHCHVVLVPDIVRKVIDGFFLPVVEVQQLGIFTCMIRRNKIVTEDGQFHLVAWKGIICRSQKFSGRRCSSYGIRVGILVFQLDIQTAAQKQNRHQI